MSAPIPEDSNEYVVLQPATPADRSNYPRYEYLGRNTATPAGMPHYDYIGLQKGDYPSYETEQKPPNEYLQLDDCTYANEDLYNYYEDITYEKAEQKSSKIIRILIIVVTLLVFFIAILIGILSWNFFWGKSKLSGEPQFCSDTVHQLTCRQSFVRNMTSSAPQAVQILLS